MVNRSVVVVVVEGLVEIERLLIASSDDDAVEGLIEDESVVGVND